MSSGKAMTQQEKNEAPANAVADAVYAECEEIARRKIVLMGQPVTETSRGYVLACNGIANNIAARRSAR